MTAPLKVAIFDVDGTLVDSQGHIHAAMTTAFDTEGLSAPDRASVRAIVGLSLPEAIGRLAPEQSPDQIGSLVEHYKDAYTKVRASDGASSSPLFPGMREVLDRLLAREDLLVAVATGKSRRGLDYVLNMHGLTGKFVSEQVADHHPSKPHPGMLLAVLSETGAEPQNAVMIGDTSFDMDMGHAAGCRTLAVDWGYHDRVILERCRPHAFVERIPDLPGAVLDQLAMPQ